MWTHSLGEHGGLGKCTNGQIINGSALKNECLFRNINRTLVQRGSLSASGNSFHMYNNQIIEPQSPSEFQ